MLNNTEIIGIDHGNRNMKTASSVFSAAIQPLQTRPDNLENILEYQNKIYYVGGQVPAAERVDKTENEDYYLLTLACGSGKRTEIQETFKCESPAWEGASAETVSAAERRI